MKFFKIQAFGLEFLARFVGVRLVFVLFAMLISYFSFDIFLKEYKGFLSGRTNNPQSYITSDLAFPSMPVGLQSVARELEYCFVGMDSLAVGLLLPKFSAKGYENCLRLADGVLSGSAAHAAAQQARAEALFGLGRVDESLRALTVSAALSPNTSWLIQRRLALVLKMPFAAQDSLSDLADAAVQRMMMLGNTRVWMAFLYGRSPVLRQMIARNESSFSAKDATSFLFRVKEIAKSGGGT